MIRRLTAAERRAINVLGALAHHSWPAGNHDDLTCRLTGRACKKCGGPMYSYVSAGIDVNGWWCLLERDLVTTRYPPTYLVVRHAVEALVGRSHAK